MYELKNQAAGAELILYDDIGADWFGEGITAKQILADLEKVADKPLAVRINSGGGDVFDAVAIYNALDRREMPTETYVDALAASAASVIAMAGESVWMAPGSLMMIHNPWTGLYGDASEMRRVAELLDQVRDSLVDIYHRRTARPRDEIRGLMDAETWMTAEEAVSEGFATRIDEKAPKIAAAAIPKDRYRNAPQLPETPTDARRRPYKRDLASAQLAVTRLRTRLASSS